MKRLVSLLLVLVMIVSASSFVFANYVDYDANEAIIAAIDSKDKDVENKIQAKYLKTSDAVSRAIKKAGSAKSYVQSLGLESEVDKILDDYTISSELFEFDSSTKLNFPIELTFSVSGVKQGDKVALLVYDDGDWDVVEAKAGKNKVTAVLNNLGKVVVLIGKEASVDPDTTVFDDVLPTDWFFEAVNYCYGKGYLNGVSATSFGPGITLTRAMVAVTIYRVEGSPAHAIDYPFLDCPSAWYQEGIAWAYEKGVITGYSDQAFGPNDPVTREQLVAMFGRYHKYKGNDLPEGSVDAFSDANTISGYAVPFVKWAVGKGLLNGRGLNGKVLLAPTGKATRAEFAQVLYNYMK